MNFTVDYFKDEVRNGFYIPTAIKQAWAANLCVLSEIDRICEKYGITYFADWGSILGAVRHGGYVPWDDDLDICMKREDYDRFREVADKELPEEFAIHDFRSKEDHWLFLARVVNSNQISFDEEHLKKYHNFPYISVVDIFIKDYLYRDEDKETERCKEIKKLIAVADGIVENSFSKETILRELTEIEKKYRVTIDRNLSPRDIGILIYGIAEEQMARVKEEESDNIGQMFPFVLKGDRGLPKSYYDEAIRLPFENTTIPVPTRYNEMLRNRYGNYLEIHKIWSGHNYPYFEGQRKNLQEVADFSLPEYTFSHDMLSAVDRSISKNDSLVGMSKSVIIQFEELNTKLVENIKDGAFDDVLSEMPEMQQFLVDYATLVENVKGESRPSTLELVDEIQAYCDAMYEVFIELDSLDEKVDGIESDRLSKLRDRLFVIAKSIIEITNKNVINKKEVLFVASGAREWSSFEPIYKCYVQNQDYDVYIVPIPTYFKDVYGRVEVSEEERINAIKYDEYPHDLELSMWTKYSLELHRPDIIYVQNPYDGENPCLTVPTQFYSSNLRYYTDELIYVQPFITEEFGENDYNDIYNMKHYVTAPGVMYADEVLVQSDNIRDRYIEKLLEFAGEETKEIWENKIKVGVFFDNRINADSVKYFDIKNEIIKNKRKKKLLYCVGLNEITEHGDVIVERIRNRLEIFNDNKSDINVDVVFFPKLEDAWHGVDAKTTDELKKLFGDYKENDSISVHEKDIIGIDDVVRDYDAYYGSASPLVPLFSVEKKPIMIADYNV